MDRNTNKEFRDVLETVFLFLKNNNFNETAEILQKECKFHDILLNNISGKVLYKCSQNGPIQEKISLTDKRIMFYTFLQKVEENNKTSNRDDHFKQLQEDYKSLLDVTLELTKLLQLNLEEQAKNVHFVLTQCEFLHPSLFRPISEEKLNASSQTTRTLNTSKSDFENAEQTNIENQEKSTSVPLTPLSLAQSEVKNVLENIVSNALKLDNARDPSSYENNVQEIRLLLEDIIQDILMSPRRETEASPIQEKCFQVLSDNIESPISDIDKIGCNEKESLKNSRGNVDKHYLLQQNSNFEVKNQIKQKEDTKKQVLRNHKNVKPLLKTPLCYLEVCRKIEGDCSQPCRCMKCLPEQSRYYCSCFDLICKDLDGEHVPMKSQIRKKINPDFIGTRKVEDMCNICEARKCSCAFQSRPKIGRSPPT